MKGLYLGREFLSSVEDCADAGFWSLSYHILPGRVQWQGGFMLRVGNTLIHLHSDNKGADEELQQFAKKLTVLKQTILEFKAEFAKGRPEIPLNKRVWLNGKEQGDFYFTGYTAYAIGGDIDFGASLSIADCHRSIIFRLTMISEEDVVRFGEEARNWDQGNDLELEKIDRVVDTLTSCLLKIDTLVNDYKTFVADMKNRLRDN